MNRLLSVFFNTDRIYLIVVKPTEKGFHLEYVNSTTHPFIFEHPEEKNSLMAADEIAQILKEIGDGITDVYVTIPVESTLISQFPGKPDISVKELRQLVNLEIRQVYPQFSFENFNSNVFPLSEKLDGKVMMLAVIIAKQDLQLCTKLLQSVYIPVSRIEVSQFNAHSAFLYNYPEKFEKTTAIFGIKEKFIDLSVLRNGKPVYYNLISFPNQEKIGEICESEFEKLLAEFVNVIDCAYFYGQGLTKDLYEKVKQTLLFQGIDAGRLNSFRMMSTDLGLRERDYCSRVAHIFPPCVGACLPLYHDRFKIY